MINTTIGRYIITRLIAEGGMASVYEAKHEILGTKAAIKVLNPILSKNQEIRFRFENEARLMASFDHPNLTKVRDFVEQPHQLSIIMELLHGEDLDQKIKRNGPLSEEEAHHIFSQILSAFQYAHEQGIVHRDIKPSNIYILPNRHVKILDFGIAKLYGQGNEMTHAGTQIGTPVYMSPEQVKADRSIDHRSDIYSLGLTLYYCVNGKPPYNPGTESQFNIFNKIVFEPLPDFYVSSIFKEIILKACKKNREDRFQSCEEFLLHLNRVFPVQKDQKIKSKKVKTEASAPQNQDQIYSSENGKYSSDYIIWPYLLQFLFGLGFKHLQIERKRSFLYRISIIYSWASFLNLILVDHGRGPLGGVYLCDEIADIHNKTILGLTIWIGWLVGHIIGLIDLVLTRKRKLTNH